MKSKKKVSEAPTSTRITYCHSNLKAEFRPMNENEMRFFDQHFKEMTILEIITRADVVYVDDLVVKSRQVEAPFRAVVAGRNSEGTEIYRAVMRTFA